MATVGTYIIAPFSIDFAATNAAAPKAGHLGPILPIAGWVLRSGICNPILTTVTFFMIAVWTVLAP